MDLHTVSMHYRMIEIIKLEDHVANMERYLYINCLISHIDHKVTAEINQI